MNMLIPVNVIHWAAHECYLQKSGELSVAHFCDGWLYLNTRAIKQFDFSLIITLGQFIEPGQNSHGYRTLPVHFASGEVISASNIPYQINNLCEYSTVLEPLQWYTEFEKIHPFQDGNGRVGSLMYNFLSDTLDDPVSPPDVFASPPCL